MPLKITSNTIIAQALGKGASRASIISSAAIVFSSFFYIFTIGSYFKIPIYFLHNRIVSTLYFTDIYIINKHFDHILIVSGISLWLALSLKGKARLVAVVTYGGLATIGIFSNLVMLVDIAALISIPLVICLLIYDRFASKKILNMHTNLYANYFSILGIALGVAGIIISSGLPVFSIPSRSIPIPNYAYAIFVLFSSFFSPILMILLINAVPFKLLTTEFARGISKKLKIRPLSLSPSVRYYQVNLTKKVSCLSLIVLLTVMLVVIPHLPTVNKNNSLIGADSTVYIKWENKLLKSNGTHDFIRKMFVNLGDRPITLLFFFTIIKLTAAEPSYIIDHIPIILGPALVLVIYFLTRELTSNDIASLFAAFLTSVSVHTMVGSYAGFYANWLALIIGFLSFVFLFRFLKSPKKQNLIIYFSLTILVLFCHTYTWTIITMVTGIFLFVMLSFKSYYPKKSIIFLLILVLCSIVVDIAKISITGSAGGIEGDIATARSQEVGVGQLPVRWSNLIDTTEIYYGASFSNIIILILGLYWLLRSNMHDPSGIFFLIFLSIGIFPLFFGNWLIQSRVFYNIPFQIPAAIALTYIKKERKGTMMLIPVCIWLIAMSIRTTSNFY